MSPYSRRKAAQLFKIADTVSFMCKQYLLCDGLMPLIDGHSQCHIILSRIWKLRNVRLKLCLEQYLKVNQPSQQKPQ